MNLIFDSSYFISFNVQKDSPIDIKMQDDSVILFILSGKVSISCIEFIHKILISGDMVFLPPSALYKLLSIEDAVVMKCKITRNTRILMTRWLRSLSGYIESNEKHHSILPIKYNVMHFLEIFNSDHAPSGFNTSEMNEWKCKGLILLLKSSYSQKELITFFSPILGGNIDFKEFVYANSSSVNNLQEFADLAKCSLSMFCREFKKNFGEPAYQWILKRKSELVLEDILSTSIPFQELADKYQFSSQAHFTKFCKQRYNQTPKELRNSKQLYV